MQPAAIHLKHSAIHDRSCQSGSKPSCNRLLAAAAPPVLRKIASEAVSVHWHTGTVILDLMAPIRHVWFPDTAVATMIVPLQQGDTSQAGSIGRDGAVGFEALLGGHTSVCRYSVEIPGTARRLPVSTVRQIIASDSGFRQAASSFAVALHAHSMQSAACHVLHCGYDRLACHLLLLQDLVGSEGVLPLTQEAMAGVLGLQRTSVTAAAQALQAKRLISYRRGKVTILDRAGLEHASCECYATIRGSYERLLPWGRLHMFGDE